MIKLLLALVLLYTTRPAAGEFTAGASAIDCTPTNLPVRVAGSIRETWKNKITDKLHVRCLLLNDGDNTIVMGTVDTCLMGRPMLDEAKEKARQLTGIPVANILISATHAHSAPAVMDAHGTLPHPQYRAYLTGRITEAIVEAHRNQRPAEIGWAVSKCPEYVFCRRWLMKPGTAFSIPFTDAKTNLAQMNPGNKNANKIRPTGPADPDVTVLMVRGIDGRPISLLANYSTHYAGAPDVSADYFGVFAQEIAKRLNATGQSPPFVGLISNGASGDANCNNVKSEVRNKYDRFIVANAVVDAAMDAVGKMKFEKSVPIRAAEKELSMLVRKPTDAEVRDAQAFLDEHQKDGKVKNWPDDYARETVLLSKWPDRHAFKVQVLRAGDFAFAATPCEMYGSTGLKIKQDSPFKTTMVVGLANGYSGYLPPPDQFQYGGYTTWRARTSMLEHQAEPKIRSELSRLMKQTLE
tara:strand:- start:505 stop:1902 length:1398 start_codon:yes stop_codon:yes gene_type:complete